MTVSVVQRRLLGAVRSPSGTCCTLSRVALDKTETTAVDMSRNKEQRKQSLNRQVTNAPSGVPDARNGACLHRSSVCKDAQAHHQHRATQASLSLLSDLGNAPGTFADCWSVKSEVACRHVQRIVPAVQCRNRIHACWPPVLGDTRDACHRRTHLGDVVFVVCHQTVQEL